MNADNVPENVATLEICYRNNCCLDCCMKMYALLMGKNNDGKVEDIDNICGTVVDKGEK